MPFTATELANIANSALDMYLDKGKVHAQAIENKPMSAAFERYAKTALSGGQGRVSLAVRKGYGSLSLAGYTHDDQVSYGNPTPAKRIYHSWREHFIGMGLTHTELKHDGITVTENGGNQSNSEKSSREQHALADLLDTKLEEMVEDYAVGWDNLIHGDGTSDTKAIAGIKSFILDDEDVGSTGGLSRVTNSWWRNRARTATSAAGAITSSVSDGGALLQVLQAERRQLDRFARSGRKSMKFAGSDFMGAVEKELRANGKYTENGWATGATADGAMPKISFGGIEIVYDPTLDNLSLQKRMYDIDMKSIVLIYMEGEKRKRCNPARPHDRFVQYQGMTTTAVMVARQLNTSGVYDIA